MNIQKQITDAIQACENGDYTQQKGGITTITKKHFRAIAAALNHAKPKEDVANTIKMNWAVCCGAIADVCASQNSRFNRETFINACENGL